MNSALIVTIISACLFGAVLLGMRIRRFLPEHHLSADTKDVVKLATGMVATMSALLLGLLVSSAKGSYDTVRGEIMQMAAKVTLFDRVLGLYGPDAAPIRAQFHAALEDAVRQMWSPDGGAAAPNIQVGNALYAALQDLSPPDDSRRALKADALKLAAEFAQLRTLVQVQSVASISRPLLVVVVLWLVIIFIGFSVLAPRNATAGVALFVSALAVAGAIFLILEMDRPFTGLVRVSSEPMRNALKLMTERSPFPLRVTVDPRDKETTR